MPQESLDSFAPEFRQGMAARAAELGDVGESSPARLGETARYAGRPRRAGRAVARRRAAGSGRSSRARRAHEELPGVEVIWRQDCYQLPTGTHLLRLQGRDRAAGDGGERHPRLEPEGATDQGR